MGRQVAAGRPTDVYEFVQGMVDYQREGPPPRLYAVYADGREVEFDGRSAIDPRGLVSIDFYNSGPGLQPSDAVLSEHAGGEGTRGHWGRGTSVAITYLTTAGMTVEVQSNAIRREGGKRRVWIGQAVIRPGQSDGRPRMELDGQWRERADALFTNFRVLNPTAEFLARVEQIPLYFLDANPRYRHAMVVEPSPSAPALAIELDLGPGGDARRGRRIECVSGVVPWKDRGERALFVDGLKVDAGYHHLLLPWAVFGLGDLDGPLQVGRRFDSGGLEGNPNLPAVVQTAIARCRDRETLDTLLRFALSGERGAYAELDDSWKSYRLGELDDRLSSETSDILSELWHERFPQGEVFIAYDAAERDRLLRDRPEAEIYIVPGSMYSWLKQAGVPTANSQSLFANAKSINYGEQITVSYAHDETNRLARLLAAAGATRGRVRVVEENGQKALEVFFPYSTSEDRDFNDLEKPGAQWLRVAAVIAQLEGFELEIVSQDDGVQSRLELAVSGGRRQSTSFTTTLDAATRAATEQIDGIGARWTRAMLRGPAMQRLEPSAEALAEIADGTSREALEEEIRALRALPTVGPDRSGGRRVDPEDLWAPEPEPKRRPVGRRGILIWSAAVAASLAAASYFNDWSPFRGLFGGGGPANGYDGFDPSVLDGRRFSIGDGLTDYGGIGVHDLDYRASLKKQGLQTHHRQLGPGAKRGLAGYYREYVGTRFLVEGGRGHWVTLERYDDESVRKETPARYASKVVFTGLEGSTRLPVRANQKVVAVETASATLVRREGRTGDWVISGKAPNSPVTVYLEEGQPNTAPPIPEEQASMVELASLRPDWEALLTHLKQAVGMSNAEKAALVLEKWSSEFVYSDDPRYDRLGTGRSAQEICAEVINAHTGMCNYSALGMVALLREAGLPARMVAGRMVNKLGVEGDPHAWAEFWDGAQWREVEPLVKSAVSLQGGNDSPAVDLPPEQKRQQEVRQYLAQVSGSAQSNSTDALLSEGAPLIKQYQPLLQAPPPTRAAKPEPSTSSTGSKAPSRRPSSPSGEESGIDLGELSTLGAVSVVSAALGALGRGWNDRRRRVAEEERQRREE